MSKHNINAMDGVITLDRIGQNVCISLTPPIKNNMVEMCVTRGNVPAIIGALVLMCMEMGIELSELLLIVSDEMQILRRRGKEDE